MLSDHTFCLNKENGSLIRGASVDDSNFTTNVVFSPISKHVKGSENPSNSKYSTLNSCNQMDETVNDHLRSVNSPVPFSPPTIPLPDTPSVQPFQGHLAENVINLDDDVGSIDIKEKQKMQKINHHNPFVFDLQDSGNQFSPFNQNNIANKSMCSKSLRPNQVENWQLVNPRRTNSNEDLAFGHESARYHNQVGTKS